MSDVVLTIYLIYSILSELVVLVSIRFPFLNMCCNIPETLTGEIDNRQTWKWTALIYLREKKIGKLSTKANLNDEILNISGTI